MMTDNGHGFYERDGGLEIGPALEKARHERGLTLDEAEQATKIRTRYLQGLENEDFGVLPDAIYVQGFVRTYANYLGLDGEEFANELKSRRQPRRERHGKSSGKRRSSFDEPLISPGGLAGAERRSISGRAVLGLLASILLIVLVIGALYYVGRGSRVQSSNNAGSVSRSEQPAQKPESKPDDKPAAKESKKENANASSASGASVSSAKAKASGSTPSKSVEVVVKVGGAPSWISVLSDGTVVYEQVAQPGFSETFEAEQKVGISTGNAGAVSLTVNGKDVGTMGATGEVTSREFTPSSQS